MSRRMRIYFYAVLGGIGGLLGWQASNVLGLSFGPNLYIGEALVGALVGLCVGLLIGITEGLMTRNIVQAIKSGSISGLMGILAGAIGLPASEILFQVAGAGYLGRALGWALFGALIGVAQSVFGKSELWKGMVGGFVGGAVGGVLLEAIRNRFEDPLVGKAVGLILLGACVGAFISLVEVALGRAWLEVVTGKLKGTEFILDKFMQKRGPSIGIGSSALKSEIVLPDPDVAPQHAMLHGDGNKFMLRDTSLSGTFLDSRRI
jgi:hypothetical protein